MAFRVQKRFGTFKKQAPDPMERRKQSPFTTLLLIFIVRLTYIGFHYFCFYNTYLHLIISML